MAETVSIPRRCQLREGSCQLEHTHTNTKTIICHMGCAPLVVGEEYFIVQVQMPLWVPRVSSVDEQKAIHLKCAFQHALRARGHSGGMLLGSLLQRFAWRAFLSCLGGA